jgi:hypothetical protein
LTHLSSTHKRDATKAVLHGGRKNNEQAFQAAGHLVCGSREPVGAVLLSGFKRRFGNEAVGKNIGLVTSADKQLGEALESAREPTHSGG